MKTLLLYFFLFLITICGNNIIPAVHSQCLKNQQTSLLHFKKSLTIFDTSLSSKLISWNSSTDCCSWVGVTCSNGHVVGLDISSEPIFGAIDNSSSLFDLQHLQSLDLSDNDFRSQIPYAMGKLMNLRYLNLSFCFFTGQIPIEISRLTRLVILDISRNNELRFDKSNLSMLVQNFTKLEELYLDYLDISAQGTHWCQSISSDLRVLSLSNCGLSRPILQSLAKLQSLSEIRLDYNNISAPFPGFFTNFSNLTSLSLSSCGLYGSVPKEIFQIPTLQTMDLSENEKLEGSLPEFPKNGSLQYLDLSSTNFSGLLPDSIGDLKMLSTIDISNCKFTGPIPRSMANLTQLVYLGMSNNSFKGSVPLFSVANLSNLENLEILDLRYNLLNGSFPQSLFSLPLLRVLHLSHNQFSGHLPEFVNVSSSILKKIDLSSNNLEGPIPMYISNFQSLFHLSLSSNNFSVSLPLNGLGQQRNLYFVDLSYNNLRTFPHFLRNLSGLEILDLSANQIHGKIPNWIWRVDFLKFLNLSCNSLVSLEEPLVNMSTSSLEVLDLHSNQLQGQISIFPPRAYYLDYSRNNFNSSIPADIGDFFTHPIRFISLSSTNLHGIIPRSICNNLPGGVLDLSNNSLTGTIPPCLTSLAVLDLRRNNLTGTIPDNFEEYCGLRTLNLGENQLQGQFPESLANCTSLEVLNLRNNQITNTFPCLLKNISSLRVLILRSNKFYGPIGCPETNGTWPILQIIDLAHNNFSGEIPGRALTSWRAMMAEEDYAPSELIFDISGARDSRTPHSYSLKTYYQDTVIVTSKGTERNLVKILIVFTSIDLSCNKFNGSIPKEMREFTSLHALNLSSNTLTGEIPSSLGNLHQLESLDLSNNNLGGQIPRELAKLNFLSILDLSNNQLFGRIPTSTQFSTFPKASFEGNKGLWGPPLTVEKRPVSSPPPSNGSHPDSGHDEIDWDLVSVEIGFIFGFGIAIGSLMFCRRWRICYYRAMYKMLLKIFPQLEERIGNHRRHAHINQRWRQ